MVQVINLGQNGKERAAEQIGAGLGRAFQNQGQYNQSQSRLSEAFSQLQPGGDYLQNLGKIAPALLSQPGGAQLLGEILPELRRQQRIQSDINTAENRPTGNQGEPNVNTGGAVNSGNSDFIGGQNQQQQDQPNQNPAQNSNHSVEETLRNPEATHDAENKHPYLTVKPERLEEYNPDQVEKVSQRRFYEKVKRGDPNASLEQERAQAQNEELGKRNYNLKVDKQISDIDKAEKEAIQETVDTAIDQKLIDDTPTERNIAGKVALAAKRIADPTKRFDYVRAELGKFKNAKDTIRTVGNLDNPFTNLWNRITGNYKSKETIMSQLQEPSKIYKEFGLIDELKQEIQAATGFGADDVSQTVFPLSEKANQQITVMPRNVNYKPVSKANNYTSELERDFPGDESNLSDKEFPKFKEEIFKILSENPNTSLVTLRNPIVQGKKYSSGDYSKAVNQLIKEERWKPDGIQAKDLPIINQRPLPGLDLLFKHQVTGLK